MRSQRTNWKSKAGGTRALDPEKKETSPKQSGKLSTTISARIPMPFHEPMPAGDLRANPEVGQIGLTDMVKLRIASMMAEMQ
jgi:hypothetical protein